MIQNDIIDFVLTTEQADFIHCSSENQEKKEENVFSK